MQFTPARRRAGSMYAQECAECRNFLPVDPINPVLSKRPQAAITGGPTLLPPAQRPFPPSAPTFKRPTFTLGLFAGAPFPSLAPAPAPALLPAQSLPPYHPRGTPLDPQATKARRRQAAEGRKARALSRGAGSTAATAGTAAGGQQPIAP